MSYIDWRSTYEVGFKPIDDQHKVLIKILNDLYESQKKGTSQAIINDTLKELIDYTIYHFSTELKFFEQYSYPKESEHIAEHDDFVKKIQSFQNESEAGNIILSMKTLDFLKEWTINHILGTDKEFGDFVMERELGG
jgi:hemerythrin